MTQMNWWFLTEFGWFYSHERSLDVSSYDVWTLYMLLLYTCNYRCSWPYCQGESEAQWCLNKLVNLGFTSREVKKVLLLSRTQTCPLFFSNFTLIFASVFHAPEEVSLGFLHSYIAEFLMEIHLTKYFPVFTRKKKHSCDYFLWK